MLNLGGTISLQIFTSSKNKTLEKKKLNSLLHVFFYLGRGDYDFLTFAFGGSWYFVNELEEVRCFANVHACQPPLPPPPPSPTINNECSLIALISFCGTEFNNGLNFNPGLGDLTLGLR